MPIAKNERVLTADPGRAVPSLLTFEYKSNWGLELPQGSQTSVTELSQQSRDSFLTRPCPHCLSVSSFVFSCDLLKLSEQRKYCELMSHYLTYGNSLQQVNWLAPMPPTTPKRSNWKNTRAYSTILNESTLQHTETSTCSSFHRS